jgi:hypothetical protein
MWLERMCDYCKGILPLHEWINDFSMSDSPEDVTTTIDNIFIKDGKLYHGRWDNKTDQENNEEMFDIIYCPVCGKRLRYDIGDSQVKLECLV